MTYDVEATRDNRSWLIFSRVHTLDEARARAAKCITVTHYIGVRIVERT